MTSKTAKPDVRLHVRFEDSPYNGWGSKYAHIYVMPVVMARGKHGRQEFTAYDVDSYDIDVPAAVSALKGLRVKAQMDDTSGHWYGYRVHFDIDQLDLREAERARFYLMGGRVASCGGSYSVVTRPSASHSRQSTRT
jgi:hypothetical protein